MGQPLHPLLPLEQFARARSSSGERPSNHSTLGFNPSCCLPGLQLLPTSTIEIRSISNEERRFSRFSSRYSSTPLSNPPPFSLESTIENTDRLATRAKIGDGSPFEAHVERTCVLRAWVVAYYWVSRSRKANLDSSPPARHLSALPTLFGRSRASLPSLPSPFLNTSLRAPSPSFTFTSFPPFFSPHPSFFWAIWPQTIARSRRIVREGGGVDAASDAAWREQGCLEDISFYFFLPESNPLCREGYEGGWRWNSFSSLLVCDCSFGEEDVSSFFLWIETLLGSIIDGFGLFHFSPLVKRIILSGIISGDLIFNFSFPRHILVEDSDEWNEDQSLIQRVFTQARHVMRCSMDLRDS